jgi:hypothetical protein
MGYEGGPYGFGCDLQVRRGVLSGQTIYNIGSQVRSEENQGIFKIDLLASPFVISPLSKT